MADPDDTSIEEPLQDDITFTEGDNEIQDVDPDTEVITTSYEITSYGADYDVHGLVRRMNLEDIVVPSFDPEYQGTGEVRAFQRAFVWRQTQMSRFIESLLLGLPVPGIFLVRDRANKLLVLDGQQRLRTLRMFYDGIANDKKFRLTNVQAPFNNLSYDDLEPEDRRRLDDSIIHATVLRQESETGAQNAVYSIYERLNTGGSPLQPQEIRIALFAGSFLAGISRLNQDQHWRNLYGPQSPRFRDHELILRILALYENQAEYYRPLKAFLNDFLEKRREDALTPDSGLGLLFVRAMELIDNGLSKQAFRPERAVNAAYVDSITIAVMRRLASGGDIDPLKFAAAFAELKSDDDFRMATLYATSSEDSVDTRIDKATAFFAGV
ncbi:DUF262 domain-containing protein [Microbacterium aurantiacum]|uniref:DUF262 domain-containing protein n=1 Tax=Microbacterium aurantiacum TaxID=162393 RepID=UPI000C80128A|nr:DUF262 domain-containing protein [Microbacterium aurantiacum]